MQHAEFALIGSYYFPTALVGRGRELHQFGYQRFKNTPQVARNLRFGQTVDKRRGISEPRLQGGDCSGQLRIGAQKCAHFAIVEQLQPVHHNLDPQIDIIAVHLGPGDSDRRNGLNKADRLGCSLA